MQSKDAVMAAIDAWFFARPKLNSRDLVTGASWEDADIVSAFSEIEQGSAISPETIWHFRDSLAAFTSRGLVAVLPHYFRFCFHDSRLEVADFLIYRLSSADLRDKFWYETLQRLDIKQRSAICMFLRYFSVHDDVATPETTRLALAFWCDDSILLATECPYVSR